MKPDRFRPLAEAEGPYASVYFDDSHDTGTCSCAPGPLASAVQRATQERVPAVGIIGWRALLGGYAIHSATGAMGTSESARGVTPR